MSSRPKALSPEPSHPAKESYELDGESGVFEKIVPSPAFPYDAPNRPSKRLVEVLPDAVRKSVGHKRTMDGVSETDWLERARAGDRAAFSVLVRLHQKRLFACAYRMVGSSAEAEDVVQDTFVRAFRALGQFDGRSEFGTWLYRICINCSLNLLRSRKVRRASSLNHEDSPEPVADIKRIGVDPQAAFSQAQVSERVRAAIDALSPSLRTTVILVLLDGVPQTEAAAILGCTEGTVNWRVHEARRKLREVLSDVLDGDMLGGDA